MPQIDSLLFCYAVLLTEQRRSVESTHTLKNESTKGWRWDIFCTPRHSLTKVSEAERQQRSRPTSTHCSSSLNFSRHCSTVWVIPGVLRPFSTVDGSEACLRCQNFINNTEELYFLIPLRTPNATCDTRSKSIRLWMENGLECCHCQRLSPPAASGGRWTCCVRRPFNMEMHTAKSEASAVIVLGTHQLKMIGSKRKLWCHTFRIFCVLLMNSVNSSSEIWDAVLTVSQETDKVWVCRCGTSLKMKT